MKNFKIIYRLSDLGESKDKLSVINNKYCLDNFIKAFDVNDIIKDFNIHYSKILPSFYGFKYIDPEAEFCIIFTNDYVGKINKTINEKYSNNKLYSYLVAISREKKINQII